MVLSGKDAHDVIAVFIQRNRHRHSRYNHGIILTFLGVVIICKVQVHQEAYLKDYINFLYRLLTLRSLRNDASCSSFCFRNLK